MKHRSDLSVAWVGLGFSGGVIANGPNSFAFSVGGSQAIEVKLIDKIHWSQMLLLAVLVKG